MQISEKQLFQMRQIRVITTPEYMVMKNYHFGDWADFQKFVKIRKSRLREFYALGIFKIKKYVQALEEKKEKTQSTLC